MRLVFDSNLAKDKRMPYSFPQPARESRVPNTLVRGFRVEAKTADGDWRVIHREENNYQRLVELPLETRTSALRFVPETTWGAGTAHLFSCEPVERIINKRPAIDAGPSLAELRAQLPAEDAAAPDSGLESELVFRGAGA